MPDTRTDPNIENAITALLTTEDGRKYLTNTILLMTEMGESLTCAGITDRAKISMRFVMKGAQAQTNKESGIGYRDVIQACQRARAAYNAPQDKMGAPSA